MYIHNYQIHNVLNVYRKQLSKGPGAKMHGQAPAETPAEYVEISGNGQRQSLIDQVSAEIVQRLADTGPQNRFERALDGQMIKNAARNTGQAVKRETEFTYTAIDENNNKSTNTLPVEKLGPVIERQD
jgi:hypothetical protein